MFEYRNKWESDGGYVYGEDTYCVVKCCGCDEISFLKRSWNSEDFEVDEDGELVNTFFVEQFPRVSIGYENIKDKYDLPDDIRKVYEETVKSISNNNLILACVGLRTILDIVCKNEGIKKKTLIKQIEALKDQNIISTSDSELLQGIRTLGNDAAHEGSNPNRETILLATNIIEHIIETKYIYKKRALHLLSTATYKYEKYVQILIANINKIKMNVEFNIEDILNKEKRRLVTKPLMQYEKRIMDDVNKGLIENLEINVKDKKTVCKRTGHVFHKAYGEFNNSYRIYVN